MPTNGETKPRSRAGAGSTTGLSKGSEYTSPTGNGSASVEATDATAGQGLLGGIQRKVSSTVDQQKNRAADGIGSIADVFRQAGGELRAQNETLASYVDMASDQMKRFADQIRQRGVNDMMDDVAEFARRRPALFIGGAFLVGLSIARFVKSSGDRGMGRYATSPSFSDVDPMTGSYGSGASYTGPAGYNDPGY